MFVSDFASRVAAAAVSIVLTAGVLAYAILPASPSLMI
ncbi:MAG: enoyl-CoA hydratase [Erythrobacter sp.]